MKSPLKDKPLNNPGQSLDRRIQEYSLDTIFDYILLSMMMIILAFFEWWRWYTESLPTPMVFFILAVIVTSFTIWKVLYAQKKLRALRQGRDGEKAVGQYLERLRESGAKVFHDILGDNFNLDHVVIAESGIYVIETKTYSKPDKGKPIVVFDGENIFLNGVKSKTDSISQVEAATNWLKQLLKESTGKDFQFRSVVLFPGWYIQPTAEAKASEVWVLNPKALHAFIVNSKQYHGAEDVNLASFHLSRYIRTLSE